MFGTEVDFIDTLKFSNSRRSISSTVSTAAVTSASTGFSYSSSRRCLGSEPLLTPTRSGVPVCFASAITSATFSGPPMLPGFSRTQCAPASIAFSASVWLKWMSAITGIGDSSTICFSASTSCSRGTATRTMSAPGVGHFADLLHRGREVRGLGLGHRLHRHGRSAADGDGPDMDLTLGSHGHIVGARACAICEARVERLRTTRKLRAHGSRQALPSHDVYGTARGPLAKLASPLAARARQRRHERFFAMCGLAAGRSSARRRLRRAGPARARARSGHHRRGPGRAPRLPGSVRAGRRSRRAARSPTTSSISCTARA